MDLSRLLRISAFLAVVEVLVGVSGPAATFAAPIRVVTWNVANNPDDAVHKYVTAKTRAEKQPHQTIVNKGGRYPPDASTPGGAPRCCVFCQRSVDTAMAES